MGLRKKTFLYSIALAVIVIFLIMGYFVLMLPSLYVDYVMDSNLESVKALQAGYMEKRSYDELDVKNPTSVFTMEVPHTGDDLYLAGKFFKLTLTVQDEKLQALLDNARTMMREESSLDGLRDADDSQTVDGREPYDGAGWEDFAAYAQNWQDQFKGIFAQKSMFSEEAPIKIEWEQKKQTDERTYQDAYYKMHAISDGAFVYEGGVSDGDYSYTTYIAMGWTQDALIITVMPTMTPQMEEITPIVMGSLPMIVAVIFLVVLISSGFFSGKIVNPIIKLAGRAESARLAEHFEADEFADVPDGGDEIAVLGRNLRELYGKLWNNYRELGHKNSLLEEENERQEVFLRASSHQLKTPITAALLLVEGMMNEVGKYRDTKAYLPEVKKQLLSMKRIVEDILYLNYHAENRKREEVDVEVLTREVVGNYAVQTEDKKLQITIEGSGVVSTDREILKKIVDNLISNAVQYTPEGREITVSVSGEELLVTNYGVTIEEKLLPNVMEAFVSSDGDRKGKGLGLYVAAYYSKMIGYKLKIDNVEDGVQAILRLEK